MGIELTRRAVPWLAAGAGIVWLAWYLQDWPCLVSPLRYGYAQGAASLIAYACTVAGLVRYRRTGSVFALTLSAAFLLTGVIETGFGLGLWPGILESARAIPTGWVVGRLLLAALFLAAAWTDDLIPALHRSTDMLLTILFLTLGLIVLALAIADVAPAVRIIHPGAYVPRPFDLIIVLIFLAAAVKLHARRRSSSSAFDRGIWLAAVLSVGCHLAASQSERPLDAPFLLAELLKVSSYALVLGGKLMDNARLYEHVQQLAVTDALTGLANYRRLLEVLRTEVQRYERTGRPFALLLADVDNLKKINDVHGHLAGSQVLCRLGRALRQHSRTIDIPARYGGDEFAVVLPDTSTPAARQFADRIRYQVSIDPETPRFTISVGIATYPHDGKTIEKIMAAADDALYQMKGYRGNRPESLLHRLSNNET